MVETVQFNVGGKLFEVSRDLIDQNPETMLAKLISETWEKEPDKPIFIDRDQDMFSHVLNYLRYGSFELPHSIPRSMFDRELDYFGIGAPESSVSQLSLGEMSQHLKQQKRRYELFQFAAECHNRFVTDSVPFTLEKDHKLFNSCHYICAKPDEMKVVNAFLGGYYGLKVTYAYSNKPYWYFVSIKK